MIAVLSNLGIDCFSSLVLDKHLNFLLYILNFLIIMYLVPRFLKIVHCSAASLVKSVYLITQLLLINHINQQLCIK